jgi:hypothetical protein
VQADERPLADGDRRDGRVELRRQLSAAILGKRQPAADGVDGGIGIPCRPGVAGGRFRVGLRARDGSRLGVVPVIVGLQGDGGTQSRRERVDDRLCRGRLESAPRVDGHPAPRDERDRGGQVAGAAVRVDDEVPDQAERPQGFESAAEGIGVRGERTDVEVGGDDRGGIEGHPRQPTERARPPDPWTGARWAPSL